MNTLKNSVFVSIPKPSNRIMPRSLDKEAVAAHRDAAFARMRKLRLRLATLGVSEDSIWEGIKRKANVKSRAELTPKNWAVLSAEFDGALRSKVLLESLVRKYGAPQEVTMSSPQVEEKVMFEEQQVRKTREMRAREQELRKPYDYPPIKPNWDSPIVIFAQRLQQRNTQAASDAIRKLKADREAQKR